MASDQSEKLGVFGRRSRYKGEGSQGMLLSMGQKTEDKARIKKPAVVPVESRSTRSGYHAPHSQLTVMPPSWGTWMISTTAHLHPIPCLNLDFEIPSDTSGVTDNVNLSITHLPHGLSINMKGLQKSSLLCPTQQ